MPPHHYQRLLTLLLVLGILPLHSSPAEEVPSELLGDWSLSLASNEPAWMSLANTDDGPSARMRIYIGSDGPFKITKIESGKVHFKLRPLRKSRNDKYPVQQDVSVTVKDGRLQGVIVRSPSDGSPVSRIDFTGTQIPPMPPKPKLANVRFGHPILLTRGNDLSLWRPHETDKINGWSMQDGILVNETPKTDFSATGDHANLRTIQEFEDFWLHVEFLIGEQRNSGIYLRGMYEAQVVDRDSRMQGMQGPGAIFGQIAPSKNAGRPGGQWQSYDLTLVDRHVTVVLNGERVIDNHPLVRPTAGAIYTDPTAPGPIYLHGDHTSVQYRNVYLAPAIKE